jgi:hypothetical protein
MMRLLLVLAALIVLFGLGLLGLEAIARFRARRGVVLSRVPDSRSGA